MMKKQFGFLLVVWAACQALLMPAWSQGGFTGQGMPYDAFDRLETTPITVGGGRLHVGFAPGAFVLPKPALLDWLKKSAEAVTVYYARFPVATARVLIVPVPGRGVQGGTAWGYRGPAIRLLVGTQSSEADLKADWKAVHEMVHLALPDVGENQLWLAEGLAVYVESIARVQAGDLTPEQIWGEFVTSMPRGLPQRGDRGLDQTHTWGRTYWGGALFYLMADVEYRKQSGNKTGLQTAMRALVHAGGTHDHDWPVDRILAVADRAAGRPVMAELYQKMATQSFAPDLPTLWRELGIVMTDGRVTFDEAAPMASIRRSIITRPSAAETGVN